MRIAVNGIGLGKNSCSLAALDEQGAVVKRRRLRPDSIPSFTKGLAPCVVAMEACCGTHHLGRLLAAQGHQVRLKSPEYVRPYVKGHKNDDRYAEAIVEAATRPTMRFVELKAEAQLDMQTLHRARDRLVGERTALINQLRAILLKRGITIPQGRRKLQCQLAAMMEQEGSLSPSPRMQDLVEDMRAQWAELDRRIETLDDNQDRIELFFLPAYAPEHNHDEFLHNDLKRSLSHRPAAKDKAGLKSRLRGYLRRLQRQPERVRAFFQAPTTLYAA